MIRNGPHLLSIKLDSFTFCIFRGLTIDSRRWVIATGPSLSLQCEKGLGRQSFALFGGHRYSVTVGRKSVMMIGAMYLEVDRG